MQRILFFLFVSFSLHSLSIVFVHVGPSPLPTHLFYTIEQARLFNSNCPIYLIAYREAIEKAAEIPSYVQTVPCESLPMSLIHRKFRESPHHDQGGEGFWIWTSERFFFLCSFLKKYQLNDVFHLENDVMLYVDLEKMLPIFHKHYAGMIGATFEADRRCVAGLLYIAHPSLMERFVHFIPFRLDGNNKTDMETIAKFKDLYRGLWIDFLPVVMPEYINEANRDIYEKKTTSPHHYHNHFEEFQSIFDAAALGVYLGGWDPKFHEECEPGEIDPHCLFNASHFIYEWEVDEEGRKIPFLSYLGKRVRINNLHITNKRRLPQFLSR